ncbi:MAG: hypothetical protein NTV22_01675 [bacterium]|nr:hypothetical protein [bacterium]
MKTTCIMATSLILLLGCSPKQTPPEQAKRLATPPAVENVEPAPVVDNQATMPEPIAAVTDVPATVIADTAATVTQEADQAVQSFVICTGDYVNESSTNSSLFLAQQSETNSDLSMSTMHAEAMDVVETDLRKVNFGWGDPIPVLFPSETTEKTSNWFARFIISAPTNGQYNLTIKASSPEARFVSVIVNHKEVIEDIIVSNASMWGGNAISVKAGTIALNMGANSVTLHSKISVNPHIAGIVVTPKSAIAKPANN